MGRLRDDGGMALERPQASLKELVSAEVMKRALQNLPDELLILLNQMLTFEDRESFGQTCRRMRNLSGCSYSHYDVMQICDDPDETYLQDSSGKKPKLHFELKSAPNVLSKTTNLIEISIYMKEVDLSDYKNMPVRSPYTPGGYLGTILGTMRNRQDKLKKISLHCDMLIDTIANKSIFAPFQDLEYALRCLANQQFETFVQLTLCSTQFSEQDTTSRDMLVYSMQELLKTVNTIGAKTTFEPSPQEGFVDMTVEYGKLEYNFSFFYYNPEMCDPETDCMAEESE